MVVYKRKRKSKRKKTTKRGGGVRRNIGLGLMGYGGLAAASARGASGGRSLNTAIGGLALGGIGSYLVATDEDTRRMMRGGMLPSRVSPPLYYY